MFIPAAFDLPNSLTVGHLFIGKLTWISHRLTLSRIGKRMNLPNVILQTKRAGQPIQIQRLGYWLICLLIICCCMNTSKAADYVWSPTNLYNATHPTSSFPWSTQWVAAPDGGQSIEVTIASGGGYYNFIAIPESYLGSGTDFKNI